VAISRNCFEGGFEVFASSTQDTAWPYALARGRPEQNESTDDDLPGQNIGIGEIVGFFEAFIAEPEDIKTGFGVVRSLIHLFKPNPNSHSLINQKRELTSLPVLRYSSVHRKGRLKILSVWETARAATASMRGSRARADCMSAATVATHGKSY
jgi:hypothetical protein